MRYEEKKHTFTLLQSTLVVQSPSFKANIGHIQHTISHHNLNIC
uniref:Uncharacterized protein n=1 Tax=Anguilla anguilla TaxID=7936 RepID=A0A0E9WHI0_ANGAN